MVDFQSALAQKYSILQQNADTEALKARSEANLTDVKAGLLPNESAAQQFAARSQGNAANAQANLTNVNAGLRPGESASENLLRRSQAGLADAGARAGNIQGDLAPSEAVARNLFTGAQADETAARTRGLDIQNRLGQAGLSDITNRSVLDNALGSYYDTYHSSTASRTNPLGYADGTEHVDAHNGATGLVDTVPAELAPGEAVLNRPAAEHLGRGFIKMLNDYGMHQMEIEKQDPNVQAQMAQEQSQVRGQAQPQTKAAKGKTKVGMPAPRKAQAQKSAPEGGGLGAGGMPVPAVAMEQSFPQGQLLGTA